MRKILFSIGACLIAGITISFAQAPKLEYGINFPSDAKFIDVDPSGNAYVAGTLETNETYGGFALNNNGDHDVFVLKINPTGTILWAKSYGGPGVDEVNAIDVDAAGNVLLGGLFNDVVDFDPDAANDNFIGANSADADGYVLKLDTDGNFLSVDIFGGFAYDAVTGVASDASGNVYVTGYFAEEADLDPTSGGAEITATGTDAFFVRMNSNGTFGWVQTVGNGDAVNSAGATVDSNGGPIFTGFYANSLDIDPGAGTEMLNAVSASRDVFILKLSPANGSFVWGKTIGGGTDTDSRSAIHADSQNNIYVTGAFIGTSDFDPGPGETILTSFNEFMDIFVAKFHPSGTLLWAHSFGGFGEDWGAGVYSDGSSVYITGAFDLDVDFDPGPAEYLLAAPDQKDIFILKLDGTGAFNWAVRLGDEEYEEGRGVVGDAAGNIYTTGYFSSMPTDVDPSGCVKLLDPETDPSYVLKFGTVPSPCLSITSQPQSVVACQGSIVTFTVAATGTNVTYEWLGQDVEGDFTNDLIDGAVYSGIYTATLTVNTSSFPPGTVLAFAAFVNGDGFATLESDAVFVDVVAAPHIGPATRCGPGPVTLKVNDLFVFGVKLNWYTQATGGTPIPGATGLSYTTPPLTATTTYYVARDAGTCEGPRAAVTAFIGDCQPIPELVWAESIGPNGRIADMYIDRVSGDVYVTGIFSQMSDFDPGPGITTLPNSGSTDVFIAKYTTAGGLIWARHVGGNSQDDSNAITVDKDGNVLVAGYFLQTGDFDPGPGVFNLTSAGSWDTFILKLDPDGDFLWAKRIGGIPTLGDISSTIATDAAGNVYVGGSFTGAVDMDPGTGTTTVTSAGDTDGLILKLDPNGNYISSTILKGPDFESVGDLAIDAAGNIFATGFFYDGTDFDPGVGTAIETGSDDQNAFALKLNSTGALVWYKTFFEPGTDQEGLSINFDTDGNIIVGGMFEGTVDFDPGTGTDIHTAEDEDAFAVKLDPNGNFIWMRTIAGFINSFAYTAVDGTDVYMFGGFGLTTDMDPGAAVFPFTSVGPQDSYITKLNEDGDFQWAVQMGGSSTDGLMGFGLDNAGNIYTGGWLSAAGDYDPGPGEFILEPVGSGFSGSMVKLGAPSPALTITAQPSAADACEGGTANFALEAEGAANIQYHWQKFDTALTTFVDVTNGGGYSGASTPTLSINTTGNVGAGTYRARVSGDGETDIFSEEVDLVIVTSLTAPATTGTARCGAGAIIVNATGSTNGNYKWYLAPTGTAIIGEVNDSYTAAISATTTYYVSIVSGACESAKTPVIATVNALPAAPATVNITRCTNSTPALTASGAPAGAYRWYDVASGGSPVSTADSFTTPTLTATTTYYVSGIGSGCESARTPLMVTIQNCANNQPPAIATTTSSAGIDGATTINLTPLISDPDNNLDLATLRVVVQPKSGATATIDQNGQLSVNYAGTSFAGQDELTIEICDIAGSCVQQVITIEVSGDILVYNAVSPNGDGKNDVFHVAYIDMIQETRDNKVTIFNRWGDVVFEVNNYNNTTNVFAGNNNNGKELPSGTYFYRIEYKNGRKSETGYLSLKR
ncbi:MAG TPA: gliding motility-associated C-terminal domain-containing protein [Cyclobacteriaceae bacterium]|nr:gliding motility-associated C-terminal domain-containing protein [Cyclobacteriaceae bacterium]